MAIAGLKYANQTLGLVDIESHDFDGYPNSGILGLAFGTIATSGEPTVFENLMANGQVLMPFFSIHLARGGKGGSEVSKEISQATDIVPESRSSKVSQRKRPFIDHENLTRYASGVMMQAKH